MRKCQPFLSVDTLSEHPSYKKDKKGGRNGTLGGRARMAKARGAATIAAAPMPLLRKTDHHGAVSGVVSIWAACPCVRGLRQGLLPGNNL